MLKKLNVIHLISEVIIFAIAIIVFLVLGYMNPNSFITVLVVSNLIHPIVYMIMAAIKEAKVMDYSTSRFIPLCMGLTAILGCVIWYFFFNLEFKFTNTISLWYGVLLLSVLLPMLLTYFLKIHFENKKGHQGPKIIRK